MINYAEKYAGNVDERFKTSAKTAHAVNDDYAFVGVKTVNVLTIPTTPLVDYTRTGAHRYGEPEELGATRQELTMEMDRSFTYTIDRGNFSDSQMVTAAGRSLKRQLDEEVIPEIDRYRLLKMFSNAGNITTGTVSDYYGAVLDASAALTNSKVPMEERVLFVKPSFFNGLKRDQGFIRAGDLSQQMLLSGSIGAVDGMNVFALPESYMPFGCDFLITHRIATTAPQKLDEYKIHDNPPGINGWLVEGRVYYDAFVLNNKRDAIYAHISSLAPIKARAESGKIHLECDPILTRAGAQIFYSDTETSITLGADVSGWSRAASEIFQATGSILVTLAVGGKAFASSGVITG